MAQNFLTRGQLNFFYENRKRLNDQIGQLLGPDIHLHDISRQQSSKSIQSNQRHKTSPIKPIPIASKKKSDKYQNFYTNFDNQNKTQKLYKQNIELQKKMITIKDQNQLYKQKATLWQKTKQFILNQVNQQIRLKSIRYCSSDSAILDQYIHMIVQILKKNQEGLKNKIGTDKDHITCRKQQQDLRKKLQEENRKVSKFLVQIEALKSQNISLKQKQNAFTLQRRARMTQIQTGIQYKFQEIQKSLVQKTQQNIQLQKKIVSLQTTIFQLKNNNSYSSLIKKDKTFSTNYQSISDKSQIDNYKKLANNKDEQINKLKKQEIMITNELKNIKIHNQKLKKVIKLAQTLNNQFLQKLEDSMRKNQTFNQQSSSEYNLFKSDKGFQQQQFHMTNKRFKIVKSRSLEKQRFIYGNNSSK